MKKVLFTLLAALLLTGCSAGGSDEVKTTGTVEAHNGPLTVEVTREGDKITAVEITDHVETPGIADPALTEVPAAIVEANSTEVEAISGATITSNAIMSAVEAAIAE